MRVRVWAWVCVCACALACGCGHTHTRARYPALEQYAKREGIPESELRKRGTGWPDYIKDYSISHGPALTPEEQKEYTAFQVK